MVRFVLATEWLYWFLLATWSGTLVMALLGVPYWPGFALSMAWGVLVGSMVLRHRKGSGHG